MSQSSGHHEGHSHTHECGEVHEEHFHHTGEHSHSHGADGHVHTNKKAVLGRLKRVNGHLESVIRMVEDDRDCTDVLIQLAAVRAALGNAGKVILQDHITECITEAVANDDKQMIEELNRAIAQFMK